MRRQRMFRRGGLAAVVLASALVAPLGTHVLGDSRAALEQAQGAGIGFARFVDPQTLTVNSTADPGSGGCDETECTLREAILAANESSAADTIRFDIPGEGPHVIQPSAALPALTSPVTIDGYTQPGASENTLEAGDDAVIKIEIRGNPDTMAFDPGLRISAGDSTVRGLALTRWNRGIVLDTNGGNTIAGTFIGTATDGTTCAGSLGPGLGIDNVGDNLIGGTSPPDRNVISCNGVGFSRLAPGIQISDAGASGNLVQGNFIGTDRMGTADLGNTTNGVTITGAPSNVVGGPTARPGLPPGNLISGNKGGGVGIADICCDPDTATRNRVEGNLIGTDVSGTLALPNFGGVAIGIGGSMTTVGGVAAQARNVISGNDRGGGVSMGSGFVLSSQNVIEGNYIGTDITGTEDLGNGGDGIFSNGSDRNTIRRNVISGNGDPIGCVCVPGVELRGSGGSGNLLEDNFIGTAADGVSPLGNTNGGVIIDAPGNTVRDNTIAFNGTPAGGAFGGHGVTVGSNATDNAIRSNSIYSNFHLGIDLLGDSVVTPNDPGDTDTGPNNLQNFPVLGSARSGGGKTVVEGTLDSLPSKEFGLDFFASRECDEPGNGEGEIFLGSSTVTTDGSGHASFSAAVDTPASVGDVVTATASDGNNTSELSACVSTTQLPGLAIDDVSLPEGQSGSTSAVFTVTLAPASDETVTVSYATADGTATAGSDYQATSGTLAFDPGATEETIDVPVAGDTEVEDDETFFLDLFDASGAFVADGRGIGTITNDDFAADLSLTKADAPDPLAVDEELTYTLRVANAGPHAASGVTITDPLPAGVTFVSAGDECSGTSTVTCNLGAIAKDGSASVEIIVKPTEAGTLSNTATVSSSTSDPVPDNNSATAETTVNPPTSADLEVSKEADPDPGVVGENLTYTVTAENRGPAGATGVVVTDHLPAQATFVSATPSQGACSGTETVTCELGAISRDSGATITIVVRPTTSADLVNTVDIGGDQDDPDTTDNHFELTTGSGCRTSMTLDAVTVLADCIQLTGEDVYLAEGSVRFDNGARIVTSGTQDSAPLVIDRPGHRITLKPLDDGSPRAGTILATSRAVASGNSLAVETEGRSEATSGLGGLAKICCEGSYDIKVSLSGWGFSASITSIWLVPASAGGGALITGFLQLPLYVANLTAPIAVRVTSAGKITSTQVRIPRFSIPNAPWAVKDVVLDFLPEQDLFRGRGAFDSKDFGNLTINPVEVANGKLRTLVATYDGTSCQSCASTDPEIGEVLRLKYAQLRGLNLDGINYSGSLRSCLGRFCGPAPQIGGDVVITALANRVVGLGDFTYFLSGKLRAHGRIFFAPAIPENFVFPSFASGVAPYLQFLKHGQDFAEGTLTFDPPHRFTVSGFWTIDQTGFLRASFFIGYDPPHFTGEGGVELRVPNSSPVLPGKKIGGAKGLVSDKAGAAQTDVRICAPSWLGGGCIKIRVSAALIWKTGKFEFGQNIEQYRTVSASRSLLARGETRRSLTMPKGLNLAAIRVTSASGVPRVKLTSPAVNGRRLELTADGSAAPGNESGALASVSPERHQALFFVARPPAGKWKVTRLGGPSLTRIELARGAPLPDLSPAPTDLPSRSLSSNDRVQLHWATTNPGRGATVDLWASPDTDGTGGFAIASGLPPTGARTWELAEVPSGRYYVFAILNNEDGVTVASRYWPGSVEVVDAEAPPAPQNLNLTATETGALVGWDAVSGASAYSVRAVPQPASAGELVEVDVPGSEVGAALDLRAGLRYAVTVQAVDAALHRSPESGSQIVAAMGDGAPPPVLAGEPPELAQVAVPWSFAPVLDDLRGLKVRLRLVEGMAGMGITGKTVSWKPRSGQLGRRTFTLEAANSAGLTTRKTFEVYVQPSWSDAPPPAAGLLVQPSRIKARARTTLTIRGQSFRRGTRVFIGRRVRRGARVVDVNTITAVVRCLKPGVYDISVRRPDGTRETVRRGLTVVGKACAKGKKATRPPFRIPPSKSGGLAGCSPSSGVVASSARWMEGSTYIVERYLPGFSAEEMRKVIARAEKACGQMQAEGIAVRYLGSAFIPHEEACFCQSEAPSAAVVEQANRLAEIPFARVVEAVPIRAERA